MHQPSLAKYRVPVFAELARRPGVAFRLNHGEIPGLPNVEPSGFDADFEPARRIGPGGRLMWNGHVPNRAAAFAADAVILSWNANDFSLVPNLWRLRRLGVGTVVWGHGFGQPESAKRRIPRDFIGKRADAVVVYDTGTAAKLIGRGFDERRVFVAQNALDESAARTARQWWLERPDELAAWRHEHDLDGRQVILFVSRLTEKSRFPLLFDALRQLSDLPEARLVLIGNGDLDAARRLAEAAGVADRVQLAGPIYDEAALAPYFITARCMCYPAGVGLSVIHAFGYGLPIVTGDDMTRHNPEIAAVRLGENGLLYKDGDVADLASKLRRLLTESALRNQLAAAAEATVTDDFNLATMVDGLEAAARFAAERRGQ